MNQKFSAVLVIAVTVFGLSSCKSDTPAENVDLTFLHTNDIHFHLETNADTSFDNPFALGGLARLKTLIDQNRVKNPNTLLLDAGDWSEGNHFYAADAGVSMLKMMTLMGYNAAAVGNHDFLINPINLTQVIEKADPSFPILGANKNLSKIPEKNRIEKAISPYTIFDLDGVRIAVIGLLTEDYFYYEFFKPGIVTNAFETASKITKELKEKNLADVIILLSHNDFQKNVEFARTIPWVNAIISGHSHVKTPKAVEVTNADQSVYVVEAGKWAQFLGNLTLTYNRTTRQTKLKSFALLPVDQTIAEDSDIAEKVHDLKATLLEKNGSDFYSKNLGHCDQDMVRSDYKEVPVSNLAADSYLAAANTDLAMESGQLISLGLATGAITPNRVFDIQPHVYFPNIQKTWTLKKLSIQGSQLQGLLNITFLANNLGLNIGWISLGGAKIEYANSAKKSLDFDPNPIRQITIRNKTTGAYEPLDPQKMYTAVLHDGLLMAARILNTKLKLGIDLDHLEDTGIEAWLALSTYIDQQKIITPSNFESGVRYQSLSADLALAEHGVRIKEIENGYQVFVTISNEGLEASKAGSFQALRSKVNDVVFDQTPEQEFFQIVSGVSIPPLNPGQKTVVDFIWPGSQIGASGTFALKISLDQPDANPRNNFIVLYPKLDKKGPI